MHRILKPVLIWLSLYVLGVAIAVWITYLLDPESVSTWLKFFDVLQRAMLGVAAVFAILIPIFELRLKPPSEEEKNPLRQVSLDDLYKSLTDKGLFGWENRQQTSPGLLPRHSCICIEGEMKVGKTREAVELIRRALDQHLIPADRVFEPDSHFRHLDPHTLKVLLEKHIDLRLPLLLFIDDLPRLFPDTQRLELIETTLRALQDSRAVYLLATARSDEIDPEVHRPWLVRQQFFSISLQHLTQDQFVSISASAAELQPIQADSQAIEAMVSGETISPEQIVIAYSLMKERGLDRLDVETAHDLSHYSLLELWAIFRKEIKSSLPLSQYIFASLGAFHAARVTPFTELVLAYAVHLWGASLRNHRSILINLPIYRSWKLSHVLPALSEYKIKVERSRIRYSDPAVETLVDPADAHRCLSLFLLCHRRYYSNVYSYGSYSRSWALFDLASVAAKNNKYSQAIELYTTAISFHEYYGFYNERGRVYVYIKDFSHALQDYNRSLRLNPQKANTYKNRGMVYAELKDYKCAIQDYDQAILLDPNDGFLYSLRGSVYLKLNDYQRAIHNYDQAILLDPNDRFLYSLRGIVYVKLNDYQRAIQDYDQAILLDPNDGFTYRWRGMVYTELKDYKRAIQDYDQAIQLDPQNPKAYNNRAYCNILLAHYDLAEADCRQAEQLDPDNPFTHARWGQLHHARKEYLQAIERLQIASSRSDDPSDFNFDIALTLLCLGDVDGALASIRVRLEAHPCPEDLEDMIPEFETLSAEQLSLPGIQEALALLYTARDNCKDGVSSRS